jgi:hypothetical protein
MIQANLPRDSKVLKDRTMNLKTDDDRTDVWVSCGQTFMAMHESNPTP